MKKKKIKSKKKKDTILKYCDVCDSLTFQEIGSWATICTKCHMTFDDDGDSLME
jgi:protein-arginine kinase activator protein McsA